MTNADIRKYCLSLAGTTEDVKWDHHLCFNVGGKMYCITTPDAFSTSLKADPEEFEELCAKPGVNPAPYLARNKWVQVERGDALSATEWKRLLRISYLEVRKKLPLKAQRALGEV
ncbi:MAG TPA: MmcQ/YjbR family DNA-binding protein [Flavobacteriales bacterium]|jgi:predicted DNA-binding protein (MmcQ/YjbR family)|nr:MmcQ/YjbR family DNA-binding protein [Flavobacteriales bacterium]